MFSLLPVLSDHLGSVIHFNSDSFIEAAYPISFTLNSKDVLLFLASSLFQLEAFLASSLFQLDAYQSLVTANTKAILTQL